MITPTDGGRRTARSVVVALAGAALVLLTAATPAAAVDVTGDGDVLVVRGSATGSVSNGSGAAAVSVMRYTTVCVLSILPLMVLPVPLGTECPLPLNLCPPGETVVQAWRATGGSWVAAGTSCEDLSGAVTVATLRARVTETVRHRIPAPDVTRQPGGTALPSVPVLFDTGQDRQITWHDTILGIPVTVTLMGAWDWTFGDGATLHTDEPGSRWPDTTVSHTYRTPGNYRVGVLATWSGTFTYGDSAPEAVVGQVNGDDRMRVRVRPAGAVLRPAVR